MLHTAEIVSDPSQKEPEYYLIQFPASYDIRNRLDELQEQNPEYELSYEVNNFLRVTESAFLLQDYGYFGVKLPGLTEEMFLAMEELNDEIHFEFDDKEEIFIKKAIFALIGLLTALIGASIVNWARKKNSGNVYSDPTGYELEDPERPGKKLRRIPDISFVSFESVSEEDQDLWDGCIPSPPSLVIEIASAKRGLKGDLSKMEKIWMKNGAEVGIVICPFTENLYIFTKGESGYITQSMHSDFTHPALPGYSDNFGNYLKKNRKK